MGKSSSIRAGRAFVELFADNTQLVRGLRLAENRLREFGSKVNAIGRQVLAAGAAGATALAGAAKYFSNAGDAVAKGAKRTQMSAESYSALAYAADMSGVSVGQMEAALLRMQRTLGDAANGTKTAVDDLARLGLRFEDLAGMKPEQQLGVIADRLNAIGSAEVRADVMQSILGRGGAAMLPLLQEGADGIGRLVDEASRLGLVVSSGDAAAAEELNDAFARMWMTIKRVAFEIGAALAPAVQRIAEHIRDAAVRVSAWIRQNQGLVVAAGKVVAGIVAGGAALIALGTALKVAAAGFGVLRLAVAAVHMVVAGLAVVVGFLLTPLGAVSAAVAAVGALILVKTGAAGKAVGWLGKKFASLKTDAVAAWGGISDALAAGDIGLAAKVAMAFVKMEWVKGTNWLKSVWYDAQFAIADTFASVWYGILATFKTVANAIGNVWDEIVGGIKDSQEGLGSWLTERWIHWQKNTGQISEEEAQRRFAYLEAETADVVDARARERRERRRRRIEELGAIGLESGAVSDAMRAERDRKLAGDAAALGRAAEEFRSAIEAARQARITADVERELREFFGPLDAADPTMHGGYGRGRGARKVGPGVFTSTDLAGEVRGFFSAAALGQQGFGAGIAERTAKATEETAKNTQDILDKIEDAGMEFA